MKIKNVGHLYVDPSTSQPLRDVTVAIPLEPPHDARASEERKNEIALQIGLQLLTAMGVP